MSEDVDDFTYWANLSKELGERLKKITSWIEGQIRAFVGILQAKGIKHVEYHIFPFDTRSISIFLEILILRNISLYRLKISI